VIETFTLMFPVWTVALSLIALYNPDRFLCNPAMGMMLRECSHSGCGIPPGRPL
jgi:hypothetical protein